MAFVISVIRVVVGLEVEDLPPRSSHKAKQSRGRNKEGGRWVLQGQSKGQAIGTAAWQVSFRRLDPTSLSPPPPGDWRRSGTGAGGNGLNQIIPNIRRCREKKGGGGLVPHGSDPRSIKRQRVAVVESALANVDVVSQLASFLEAKDLCQVKATCKALGSANVGANGLSMVDEAARRIRGRIGRGEGDTTAL